MQGAQILAAILKKGTALLAPFARLTKAEKFIQTGDEQHK
jgi:hypothetical protein